jgi:PKD repeat protein
MDKDKVPPIIGAVLLVAGILVVFFVFTQAFALVTNVGGYFREQFPEDEGDGDVTGPTAAFSWNADELDVNFVDESEPGDADIRHWEWDFGDGSSSNQNEPSYTYNSDGDYRVSLRVEDQNGESHTTHGDIQVEMGNFNARGQSDEDFGGDFSFELGMGNILFPIAAALLVGMLFMVMFLVGAAMIKAGWNLIKPGPSTLKLKIKPKKLEVEQAHPDPAYSPQPVRSSQPVSAQPQQAYHPQPHPDAVIASMRALPANQPQQQTGYAQAAPVGYNNQQAYTASPPPQPMPQNPAPPTPSFESQPIDNSPHPDQTDLGAYPSSPNVEEPIQSTPTPEVSEPSPSTQATEAPAQKVETQQPQATTQPTYQATSNQPYKARAASQPAQRTSNSRSRQNTSAPRQQQKRSQKSNKKSQSKRGKNSKSKKGKGKKKR